MLKEIKGNVWDIAKRNDAICILTNNTVINGRNVMGAGIAKEALDRNSGLDKYHALCIEKGCYILGQDERTGAEMLRFPTKDGVWNNSSVDVITQSLYRLKEYCICNSDKIVYLPRPGCGCGGLDWETEVKPLCENILENVENVVITSF